MLESTRVMMTVLASGNSYVGKWFATNYWLSRQHEKSYSCFGGRPQALCGQWKTALLKQTVHRGDLPMIRTQLLAMEGGEMDEELAREVAHAKEMALEEETNLVLALQSELQREKHHLPSLRSVIEAVLAAQLPNAFHKLIQAAIDLIKQLEEMEELQNLVLALNSRTIAELKSFKKPLRDVEVTMRAVYLLLGSSLRDIKTWQGAYIRDEPKGKLETPHCV